MVSSWWSRNGIGGGGGTGASMTNSAVSSLSRRLNNPFLERPESRHSKNIKDNRGMEGRGFDSSGEAVTIENYRTHHNSLAKAGNLQRAVNSGRIGEHEGVSTKQRILQLLEDKVANLFSNTRLRSELRCNREVDKEIQVHLSRYAHRKSVQCDLVLAPDMELLAEDCRVKHPAFPVVQLKPEARMQVRAQRVPANAFDF